MKNKVLFIASTFSHIRNFHLPYLKAFQDLGWEVHIACGGKAEKLPYVDQFFELPFEKSIFSPKNFRAASIIRRLVREESYQLLCPHATLASFFARLAIKAMPRRPKLLCMSHGYLFDDSTNPLKRFIYLCAEKFTVRQTDLLLTMNEYDYELARREHLGLRVEFIPGVGVNYEKLDQTVSDNKEDIRKQLGVSPDALVLFYAAELSGRKSQQTLIHAMTSLPDNIILILAGDGALRDEYVQLAETLGVSNRVIFPGHISPVGPWYVMSDIVVSSSRSEGLPFNIMEAMHLGKPIVASRVKGHEDLIQDGVNGLLFPYEDSNACVEQIKKLLNNPVLCHSLGSHAAVDSDQYSIENVFPVVWNKYLSVIK